MPVTQNTSSLARATMVGRAVVKWGVISLVAMIVGRVLVTSLVAFWKAMKILNSTPKNTAMIGDQLFMDILGANLLGIYSIFTELLTPEVFEPRKLMRLLEKWLLEK